MRRYMAFELLIISLLYFTPQLSYASQLQNQIDSVDNPISLTFSNGQTLNASIKSSIQIGNKKIELYPTFDSIDESLNLIKDNRLVRYIEQTNNFGAISNLNWKEYRHEAMKLLDSPHAPGWCSESCLEYQDFLLFVDIMENDSKNKEIESLASIYKNVGYSSEINQELYLLLPYNYNSNNKSISINGVLKTQRSFNRDAAFNYALTYAWTRNPEYPSFDRGDCANFASQILENGGEPQVSGGDYNSVRVGWWHKYEWGQHIQSHSWSVADTFMKYFHAQAPCGTDHNAFSRIINEGDFIAYDKGSDGDWDHVGYVMILGNGMGPEGYRDYHVAQHSSDYHADVSDDINGWETLNGKATYGYARRPY